MTIEQEVQQRLSDAEALSLGETLRRAPLLKAIKRALPWLRKAHAEGIHEQCALPDDLPETIRQMESLLWSN